MTSTQSWRAVAFGVVMLMLSLAQPLDALCVTMRFRDWQSSKELAMAFHGTVTDVQRVEAGLVVTFQVLHVWKGRVPSRITVYESGQPQIDEWLPFLSGKSYFVIGYPQSKAGRTAFGLPEAGSPTFETNVCLAHEANEQQAIREADGSRGYTPR